MVSVDIYKVGTFNSVLVQTDIEKLSKTWLIVRVFKPNIMAALLFALVEYICDHNLQPKY